MFKNSYSDNSSQNIATDGVAVRKSPLNVPAQLKQRILAGEDPFGIWVSHLNREDLGGDKKTFKFSDEIYAEDVIAFCRFHKTHPAHLIPLDSDPRLSLPASILEASILIAKSRDATYSQEDRDLANTAINFEHLRIKKFLSGLSSGKIRTSESTKSLVALFEESRDSPPVLKEARKQYLKDEMGRNLSANWQEESLPIDMSNILGASAEETARVAKLKKAGEKGKLDTCYRTFEQAVWLNIGDSMLPEEILFAVEGELDALGTDSRAATIEQIENILCQINPLVRKYGDLARQKFALHFGMSTNKACRNVEMVDFADRLALYPIAVNMAQYFAQEAKWEKAKKNERKRVSAWENQVEYASVLLAKSEDYKEGTFFSKFMNNMLRISATLSLMNRSYPMLIRPTEPK